MRKLPEKIPKSIDQSLLPSIVTKYYENEEFRNLVNEYNEKYLYWDELKYRISDRNERNNVWVMMKTLRSMRSDRLQYSPILMRYTQLPEIIQNLHRFDTYLSGHIQIHNRDLKLDGRFIVNSLIEESISSSLLEGAVTTRREAREMLEKKKMPRNDGEQMVMNNYETLHLIKKYLNKPLTPDFILEIQRTVTKETIPDEDVGSFRNNNEIKIMNPVYGTIHHIPPDFKNIHSLMDDVCDYVNRTNDSSFIHPIIKGIVLHFLIGYIHPFNDGNGRTARSLFYWYTLSHGYWFMEYLSISPEILQTKNQYALAYLYSEYDDLDLTYFIRYNLECLNLAFQEFIRYVESVQELQLNAQMISRSIEGLTQRQAEILTDMNENPNYEYTISQISEKFVIARESARTDLLHLHDMNLISKVRRGKTFYFYVDRENLKYIDRINSGNPEY